MKYLLYWYCAVKWYKVSSYILCSWYHPARYKLIQQALISGNYASMYICVDYATISNDYFVSNMPLVCEGCWDDSDTKVNTYDNIC